MNSIVLALIPLCHAFLSFFLSKILLRLSGLWLARGGFMNAPTCRTGIKPVVLKVWYKYHFEEPHILSDLGSATAQQILEFTTGQNSSAPVCI